ncbi:autotransporter outer membrane beta-barrel domain-containing protein [Anaerobiospirillum succiniciproducens]|uniref:autotransporter outer membrane beta-barrel domain-containing protein n=1 Tax=Anaerobiospirillum succiniciproducens TaxID=13335 RepID=UPI0004268897|nr:autotransporter outer membrane beta-barrel domain-containing protein [Anaerobiospirillum succiniciproducens]
MKQTNNAIKFLMAQYRAIFKNANIAMVAAMAAAALAAGQAQAAGAEIDVAKFKAIAASEEGYILNGNDSDPYTKINISSVDQDINNKNKFTLNLTGGEHKIESNAGTAIVAVTAENASIKVNGDKATLNIGANGSGATVKLASIDVAQGTLNVGKAGASAATTLTANTINLGTAATGEQAKATPSAKLVIGLKSTVGGDKTTLFTANNGAAITLDGGANKDATIKATNIKLNGGTLSIADGQGLKLDGKVAVAAVEGTDAQIVKNAGELTLTNSATFGKGSIKQESTGSIQTGTDFDSDLSLTFNAADWNNVFAGKVKATFKQSTNHTLGLNFEGEDKVDLNKVLDATSGGIKDSRITATNGAFSVTAENATFDKGAKIDTDKGSFVFNTLTAGTSNKFEITKGTLNIKDKLEVAGEKTTLSISGAKATPATLTLDRNGAKASGNGLVVAETITLNSDNIAGSILNVENGTWDVKNLTVTKGTVNVKTGATLGIDGTLTTKATDSVVNVTGGTLDLNKSGSKVAIESATVKLSNTGVLEIGADKVLKKNDQGAYELATGYAKNSVSGDSSSTLKLVSAADQSIVVADKAALDKLVSDIGFTGLISGISLEKAPEDGATLDKISANTDAFKDVQVSVGKEEVKKAYSVDSVVLTGDAEKLTLSKDTSGNTTGSVTLNGPKNGMFVSKDGKAAGVSLSDAGASVVLAGSGKIGAIEASAAGNGKVTVGNQADGGTVSVAGIGSAKAAVGSLTVNDKVTLNSTGDISVQDFIFNGDKLTATEKTITVGGSSKKVEINGSIDAKALEVSADQTSVSIANGAIVDVDSLTLKGTTKVTIGTDGTDSTSGTLEAGKLTLAKGTLFVDPQIGKPAAIAAVKTLSKTESDGKGTDAQVLDGNIIVGKNSAVGVGFDTRAEVEDLLIQSNYMDPVTKSFKEGTEALQAALILNTPIKIDNGAQVVINAKADVNTAGTNDQLDIAANSALVINDSVFSVGADGKKTGTAVSFGKTGGSGTVSAANGQIILAGDFDGADTGIQIFGNATGAENVNVVSANGVLSGRLGANGAIASLTPDPNKLKGMFTTVSEPVRKLLQERVANQNNAFDKSQLGAQFLGSVTNDPKDLSGVKADAAAHAATYAGAQQAAVASVTTMADAMFGRVGAVGVEAASIAATGSQANGGVWLTPMYKSVDADGFNAQGASYGSEVDLAGVAFGTDTVNGNMRFGAVFNIGSGDADGKGNGNGLKDEFDYYGFGIYSAMGFGNFALVGDASLTVISHDVKGFDLHGKADTKAVTMGLTGQYTFATPAVDVTPHLGARFVRLDTESYDLNSAKGTIATTDFDVQNVFSVPVGVTLSKAFVAGGWSLAPNADLTLTFNSGDTEAKSTTTFTGARAIDLNSEVMDEVTYGVTLGLGAQYGAFGTSFGINYTGSENTDAFGVNAQCRYMF